MVWKFSLLNKGKVTVFYTTSTCRRFSKMWKVLWLYLLDKLLISVPFNLFTFCSYKLYYKSRDCSIFSSFSPPTWSKVPAQWSQWKTHCVLWKQSLEHNTWFFLLSLLLFYFFPVCLSCYSFTWKWKLDSKMVFLNRSAGLQCSIVWKSAQEEKVRLVMWWLINRVDRIPSPKIPFLSCWYLDQNLCKPIWVKVIRSQSVCLMSFFFCKCLEFFRYKGECLKSFCKRLCKNLNKKNFRSLLGSHIA